MQGSVTSTVQYRFDFLKYRVACLIFSAVILAVGLGYYLFKSSFAYHIDFTGGAEIRVSFAQPIDTASLRAAMSSEGWAKDAAIQNVGKDNKEFLIRIGKAEEGVDVEAAITGVFAKHFAGNTATIGHLESIGAEVGKDTKWNAIYAILLSLLVLALYIAIRSEFRFGIGAALSLLHDILVIMVFILVTQEPISLHILAAVLAIIGYSMNDTIVIFSKIRENFKRYAGQNVSEYDLVNLSINQTLVRTTLTSFATLLCVISILLLGGETLRGLAVVTCVGIVIGTFSSIYIASPSMLLAGALKKN